MNEAAGKGEVAGTPHRIVSAGIYEVGRAVAPSDLERHGGDVARQALYAQTLHAPHTRVTVIGLDYRGKLAFEILPLAPGDDVARLGQIGIEPRSQGADHLGARLRGHEQTHAVGRVHRPLGAPGTVRLPALGLDQEAEAVSRRRVPVRLVGVAGHVAVIEL